MKVRRRPLAVDVDADFDFFDVDEGNLVQEWRAQVKTHRRFCREQADKKAEHRRREAQLKVIRAEVRLDIRKRPKHYGIIKLSNDVVNDRAEVDPRVRKAVEREIVAAHAVEICVANVQASAHRKAALEDLVILRGQQYFAEPKVRLTHDEAENFKQRQATHPLPDPRRKVIKKGKQE
jgi:hypothetical protein